MSIASGTIQYQLGTAPVTGCGFALDVTELDDALTGGVAEVVFDDEGTADLSTLLSSVADTEFEYNGINRILSGTPPPENWRVGEAIAEIYLCHHKGCYFPWPDGRDERKSGSSLPGADLVGFQSNEDEDVFAFGEVKTSSEAQYPPGAMYGRTGLKLQIEDLKDSTKIKDDLVRYLGHRAQNAPWKTRFKNASKKYLQSNTNISVFGILIRDVEPNQDDLKARVSALSVNFHADMNIELMAAYLPAHSISELSNKVVTARDTNGGAV